MTAAEFVGCSLIIFGPPGVLFLVFIAKDPLKVIVLTASAFFWLISLLLSSILWFAVVPLRNQPAFALVFSVLFQELMRLLLFYTVRRAELGLQRLAFLEDVESVTPHSDAMVHGVSFLPNDMMAGGSTAPLAMSDDEADSGNRVVHRHEASSSAPQQPVSTAALLDSNLPKEGAISPRALSYVAGLGFGLAYGAFSSINMLADMLGPATIGYKGDASHFFISSAFAILAMVLLQTIWSVITFHSIHGGKFVHFLAVAVMHMILACLTLLMRESDGAMVAILVLFYCVLAGCIAWAFHTMGGDHRNLLAMCKL